MVCDRSAMYASHLELRLSRQQRHAIFGAPCPTHLQWLRARLLWFILVATESACELHGMP